MNNTKKAAVTELSAFCTTIKKSARIFVDKRNFYSLSYRYDGKILIDSNGERLFSTGGSITFVPKGLSYYTEIIEDTRMAVIHFKLDRDIDFRNAAVIQTHDNGIRLLFEMLIRNFHIDSPVDFHCMSVFYDLLARLTDASEKETPNQASSKIRAIKAYVEQNYADPSLYIEALAQKFSISTSYLRREFLKAYGISPVSFLRSVRVGNAKNMLESGYLSVTEIAEQCGFSSDSYFIQVFHKLVGESPDRYRRKMRE